MSYTSSMLLPLWRVELFQPNCSFDIAEGACHTPPRLSAVECRQRQKKYLDQRRLAKEGAFSRPSDLRLCSYCQSDFPLLGCCVLGPPNISEAPVPCGRFTEEYIEALKGLVVIDAL